MQGKVITNFHPFQEKLVIMSKKKKGNKMCFIFIKIKSMSLL